MTCHLKATRCFNYTVDATAAAANLARQPDRSDCNSETSLVHFANLQQPAFGYGLKHSVDSVSSGPALFVSNHSVLKSIGFLNNFITCVSRYVLNCAMHCAILEDLTFIFWLYCAQKILFLFI